MEDKELVTKALDGDEQSFVLLYEKYLKIVYGYIYKKVGNRHDAEDVTSESFMTALRSLKNYAGRSSFKNWLFGIAKHKLLDFYQKKYLIEREVLVENIILPEVDFESDMSKSKRLQTVLDKLPDKYKEILSLRFLNGLKTHEISLKLGISVSNVKVMQHRALKMAKTAVGNQ
jgi:RNA polymerase sigma-70 factor (ECF subfamily)